MTLDEAIETLAAEEAEDLELGLTWSAKAKRKGIEALERHRDRDIMSPNDMLNPLPSETKD